MDSTRVTDFLQAFTEWARARGDIRAAALVGSYARGQARPGSDVDLVLLCDQPRAYLAKPSWVLEFGRVTGRRFEDYGPVTSLRVWYEDGLEVEYGIALPEWASQPLDEGTRRVMAGGMQVLFERDGLLSRHQPPDQSPKPVSGRL